MSSEYLDIERWGLKICTSPCRTWIPIAWRDTGSYVETLKWDYVHMNPLHDAETVLKIIPEWFRDYNEHHHHKGLKMQSPKEYRRNQLKLEQCRVN